MQPSPPENNVTKFWLIRHAPISPTFRDKGGNFQTSAGKFIGQIDIGCDTNYPEQLKMLVEKLPNHAYMVTSSLKRTKQTADALLASGLNPAESFADKALCEQNFGDWQGMDYDSHYHKYADFWEDSVQNEPPNGESFALLFSRIQDAMMHYQQKYQGRDVIAITHAGVIRCAIAMAQHGNLNSALKLQIHPLSLSRIDACYNQDGLNWQANYHNHFGVTSK